MIIGASISASLLAFVVFLEIDRVTRWLLVCVFADFVARAFESVLALRLDIMVNLGDRMTTGHRSRTNMVRLRLSRLTRRLSG